MQMGKQACVGRPARGKKVIFSIRVGIILKSAQLMQVLSQTAGIPGTAEFGPPLASDLHDFPAKSGCCKLLNT